jgi:hypothetical protein
VQVIVWFADTRGEVYAPCMRIGGERELFEGGLGRLEGRGTGNGEVPFQRGNLKVF